MSHWLLIRPHIHYTHTLITSRKSRSWNINNNWPMVSRVNSKNTHTHTPRRNERTRSCIFNCQITHGMRRSMTDVNISTVCIRCQRARLIVMFTISCKVYGCVHSQHTKKKHSELNKLFNGVDGYVPSFRSLNWIANGIGGKTGGAHHNPSYGRSRTSSQRYFKRQCSMNNKMCSVNIAGNLKRIIFHGNCFSAGGWNLCFSCFPVR